VATPNPARAGQTVPTRTPGPRLNLGEIRCDGQDVRVEFVAVQLPNGVDDYGAVSYTINGQTRTAKFEKRTGAVAHYVDLIPPAEQASDGVYEVTTANVVITASGKPITLTLNYPGARTAICQRPPAGRDGEQPCSKDPVREAVEPGGQLRLFTCHWSLTLTSNALAIRGALEMTALSPDGSFPPNAGDLFFGQHVDLTLFDAQGNAIHQPVFANPVELCVAYSAADADRAGRTSAFVIQTYDVGLSRWVALPTRLDAANSTVCAALPHLSRFALAAKSQAVLPASLPVTGGSVDLGIPGWIWLMIGLTMGGGLALLLRWRLNVAEASRQ
jgi:hypothetical protein